MLSVAVRRPVADGSNFTWKVVVPATANGVAGSSMTVKSPAFAPPTVTFGAPLFFPGTDAPEMIVSRCRQAVSELSHG